jgi:hypothetical protein
MTPKLAAGAQPQDIGMATVSRPGGGVATPVGERQRCGRLPQQRRVHGRGVLRADRLPTGYVGSY